MKSKRVHLPLAVILTLASATSVAEPPPSQDLIGPPAEAPAVAQAGLTNAAVSAVTAAPAAKEDKPKAAPCRAPFPFTKKHKALQRTLDRRLRAAGFGKYLDRKQLGVALVDLSTKGRVYYSGINDNEMMYAASLPKIAILLAVIKAVNEGKLEWTHEYDTRLQNMIVASSNTDASWGAELVGLTAIEETMRDPDYCLYDNKHGGLWVGRPYGPGRETNRDPLEDLSHASTARQAARFYTMLDEGLLVSKHWSFRMLGLMSPPVHHHKFVGGLNGVPGVVFLARKSGSWRHWHSDSALIQHHGRRYVAVGISEHKNGEKLMQELIKVLDDIVMDGAHRPRREQRQARAALR